MIIAIGGEPASGKTTLISTFLKHLGTFKEFQFGLLKGMVFKQHKIVVLGVYDGSLFAGTDRLSMAVQPNAERFLDSFYEYFPGHFLIFEGDRLFNESFLRKCKEVCPDMIAMILTASDEEKKRRHIKRADSQSDTWLQGRRTKLENLKQKFEWIQSFPNSTVDDYQSNLLTLLEGMGINEKQREELH